MLTEVPDNLVFMKVGNHAHETFEQILARKRAEGQAAGRIFWGYGGAACNPITQVQPFARRHAANGETIFLAMEHVDSRANPEVEDATQFSENGRDWQPIPPGVRVTGSKYAIILQEITPGDLILPLQQYRVGVGPSEGTVALDYLQGRTDKACLSRHADASTEDIHRVLPVHSEAAMRNAVRRISFLGRMVEPYAVYLK